jgi:hypothetical protein
VACSPRILVGCFVWAGTDDPQRVNVGGQPGNVPTTSSPVDDPWWEDDSRPRFNPGPGSALYQGGTLQAQLQILLHELGHLVRAKDFQHDLDSTNAQRNNNFLVGEHCTGLIEGTQ